MDKYTIEFSKDSKKDLIDITNYIKYNLQEPNISKKLIAKIKSEISKLKDNPLIYAIMDDTIIKKLEIRRIMVDNYIVFYRVNEENKKVQIARIMYGKRNWLNLL